MWAAAIAINQKIKKGCCKGCFQANHIERKVKLMPIIPDKYRGSRAYSLVYCTLIYAATKIEAVTYERIAEIMDLEPVTDMVQEVGHLLGEINEDEHDNGRPMLSAVAVNPETKMPGEGFFKLAIKLQKFHGTTVEDKRVFWREEIQKVYETW
jgi:hypothetical protein